MFPSIFRALRRATTLPIATATTKRSFSTLEIMSAQHNILKSSQRFGTIHTSRYIEVVPDEVLDIMTKKPRKLVRQTRKVSKGYGTGYGTISEEDVPLIRFVHTKDQRNKMKVEDFSEPPTMIKVDWFDKKMDEKGAINIVNPTKNSNIV